MNTISLIFIYDKDENLQLILNNTDNGQRGSLTSGDYQNYTQLAGMYIGNTDGFDEVQQRPSLDNRTVSYRQGWFAEQLNGAETLEFETLADNPSVELIEVDGRAVTRNADGEYVEFIIRIVEDIDYSGSIFKNVQAEGGEYELIDEWITQYKASNVTLKIALGAILQGTRWQVGDIDDFGTQSVDLRNMNVKAGIYELIELFGGERKSRVEVSGNRVINRYLDVLKNRGVDTGKRFEAGKDIISTSRVIDSSGIKTAMYGYGASQENDGPRITFADVEWVKANGDPLDKPLGQTWLGDPDALQRYGYKQGTRHRKGGYDGQEEDPAELLFNTWKELQTLVHANETYDYDVIMLEEMTGYAHEKVRLGDRTWAINKRIYPEVITENSIIEFRQNLNDRRLSEVTLGNFRRAYDMAGKFNRVEKVVDEKQGNWNEKTTPDEVETIVGNETSWVQDEIDAAQDRIDNEVLYFENLVIDVGEDARDEAIASAKIYADDNAVMKGQFYNGVSITNSTGFLAIRNDNLAQTIVNASQGISIQARESTNSPWENKFHVGTDGKAYMKGVHATNGTFSGQLNSVGGTFTGDLIGAKIYSESTTFVGSDLTVTDNVYLGSFSDSSKKTLYFNNGANIYSSGARMYISTSELVVGGLLIKEYSSYSEIGALSDRLNIGSSAYNVDTDIIGNLSVKGTPVSLQGHTHDDRHVRKIGSQSVWLEPKTNGFDVFVGGDYKGYLAW